jgi:site-specific DNA-methyltransferase (adenine-specific)
MSLELNKIHLGDSYELIKQIPDKSIDLIYTDIPYEFHNGKGGGFMEQRIGKVREKEMVGLDNGIDFKIYDDFIRVLKDINIFIWLNKYQIQETLNYFLNRYDLTFEILTWNKINPIPMTSNVWLSDIEYCLYFRSRSIKLNDGYELKSKWHTSPINKADKDEFAHPTIKPLELVKRHILHTTKPNAIVLDAFVGSGTTAVASKELGRQYLGIEIEPKWHKIAVDRVNGINARGEVSLFADFDKIEIIN